MTSFTELLTNPIIVGTLVGLPTSVFGVLAYKRAERLDRAAIRAADIATQGDAVQRVIDGLDRMVDNLQVDNKEVREKVKELRTRLAECNMAYAELKRATGTP